MRRATAKIERAVGDAGPPGVAVDLTREEEATTVAVRAALEAARALAIRYYTAGRDAVSQRTVDPMRLLVVEGRGYLEAWCRNAEAVRLFRLDRVEDVTVLDEPAAPPPGAEPTDVSEGLFRPSAEHRTAVLLLEPVARWIAEYYPVDDVVELGDGRARVALRFADPGWLVRLVLGLGGGARVLEPPELAGAVARRAREALAVARRGRGVARGRPAACRRHGRGRAGAAGRVRARGPWTRAAVLARGRLPAGRAGPRHRAAARPEEPAARLNQRRCGTE